MSAALIIAGAVGPWQIVLIVVLIVIFFGGKKIPELMRGLGQGMKEFKKAAKDLDDDASNTKNEQK
jgi:sec-independent protein translocase protein TatA